MGASGSKADSNWKALHGKGAEKDIAVFGAGCYWGTEAYFVKKFGDAKSGGALEATAVGFMGPQGAWANPTYAQVIELPFYPQAAIIAEPPARLVTLRNNQRSHSKSSYACIFYHENQQARDTATPIECQRAPCQCRQIILRHWATVIFALRR
jgi:hypothetical protein